MLYKTNPFYRKNLIEIQPKRPPKRQPWNIERYLLQLENSRTIKKLGKNHPKVSN